MKCKGARAIVVDIGIENVNRTITVLIHNIS